MKQAPRLSHSSGESAEYLTIGKVLRPWGIRGQMKIESLTDYQNRFKHARQFFIDQVPYQCLNVIFAAGGVVLALHGVESRTAAEELRGSLIQIREDEVQPLPDGTFYHHQILGLIAWTPQGRRLGAIEEILETGSNDVYVVRNGGSEILIPSTSDVVMSIDLQSGKMIVQAIPGLL